MSFRTRALAVLVLAASAATQAPNYHHLDWASVPTVTGTKTLQMDVYLTPHASTPVPVVLFVHGGGWSSALIDDQRKLLSRLPDRGAALAPTSYRFSQEAI